MPTDTELIEAGFKHESGIYTGRWYCETFGLVATVEVNLNLHNMNVRPSSACQVCHASLTTALAALGLPIDPDAATHGGANLRSYSRSI